MKKILQSIVLTLISPIVLLFLFPGEANSQTFDYGKSYINVTKGLNGGTVETGDTLEMRASFVVKTPAGFYDSCRFIDVIPAGTAYIPGTLRILTNEGKIYKSFTDAALDDCGRISGTTITINMGYNTTDAPATAFRRGRIRNTHKPSFYGSTCIMIASYRIRVTAALGSFINTGGGNFTYKLGANPIQTTTFPVNNVAVCRNYGICPNTVGTNALGAEFNGTFGSGQPRNRGTSANVPAAYAYQIFTSGQPQDYNYGVANNTSNALNYTTLNTWPKPDNSVPTHRVFNVWDIIGDHTGAADPLAGNPAADTVANPNAGYMVVINAAYRIDSAFQHTISGLCPNTYYELSAWLRNICSKCGCDSNGKGATNATGPPFYIPTGPGDSSGVRPNLTLRINGVDYYSTGNLPYTGRWIKKGFTYLTGPSQTSFTMTIRNNAPGGGGNDWAIDDISVATCTPNLNLTPNGNFQVCYGNQVDMQSTVRCYFPNYVNYLWEKSIDDGATWTNTGVSGTGSPVLFGGEYVYTAYYPSFLADSSVHGNMFRIRVASTLSNLMDPNCSFLESNTIIVMVNNCMDVLKTELLSFDGKLADGYGDLKFVSGNEQINTKFEIERSNDGTSFTKIATVNGAAAEGFGTTYNFTDESKVSGNAYYRIKVIEGTTSKYSKIVLLNTKPYFGIKSLINPFDDKLSFDLITTEKGIVYVALLDIYGRVIKDSKKEVQQGLNSITINNLNVIRNGSYNLLIKSGDKVINKRVIKINK